jgi:hypothetical protein
MSRAAGRRPDASASHHHRIAMMGKLRRIIESESPLAMTIWFIGAAILMALFVGMPS